MTDRPSEQSAPQTPEFSYQTDINALLVCIRSATRDEIIQNLTMERQDLVRQVLSALGNRGEATRLLNERVRALTPHYEDAASNISGGSAENRAAARKVLLLHRKCVALADILANRSTSDSDVHIVQSDTEDGIMPDPANDSDVTIMDDETEPDSATEEVNDDTVIRWFNEEEPNADDDTLLTSNDSSVESPPDSDTSLTSDEHDSLPSTEPTVTQQAAADLASTPEDIAEFANGIPPEETE